MAVNKAFVFWLPVVLCMAFIFHNSSIPGTNIPAIFAFQDIAYHLLIYLALGLLFSRAIINTHPKISIRSAVLLTVAFALTYGITDELHQVYVPYRTASILDVLVDALGAAAGSFTYVARKCFAAQVSR